DVAPFENPGLGGTVANDLAGEVFRRRADMKVSHLTGTMGEAVGVAPDLAVLAVHAGIFVVRPAQRGATRLARQAEVGGLGCGVRVGCWRSCGMGSPGLTASLAMRSRGSAHTARFSGHATASGLRQIGNWCKGVRDSGHACY